MNFSSDQSQLSSTTQDNQITAEDESEIRQALEDLSQPISIIQQNGRIGVANPAEFQPSRDAVLRQGYAPALSDTQLGDASFMADYGVHHPFYAGSMANGISSESMVIELGKAGFLGSFGAGGCPPARIEAAINRIKEGLPAGPYAFNLLNSPNEPVLEERAVNLFLKHQIPVLEASAYLRLTAPLVHYRVAGLQRNPDGSVAIGNRVLAKVSRREVAQQFLSPAPQEMLNKLLEEGKITPDQAEMAQTLPMADDLTVEGDSGGHTDNRPLVGLIPSMVSLRDELQEKYNFMRPVRIGAAGGIATPQSALAAFMMGAGYVVTGSVNQSCIESGASEHTRGILAQAGMADVAMAPASDMFEMGVKVQVLKRGTMFAQRASRLYDVYTRYNRWEEVPQTERDRLESTVFKRKYAEIWADTVKFFEERDPRQIERANQDPHQQMALVFRWYLGLSSRWSNIGEKGREMDYQIWCGPSMGVFNEWVQGTYLAEPANRRIVDVTTHILHGAAYLARVRMLQLQGIRLPLSLQAYYPKSPLVN